MLFVSAGCLQERAAGKHCLLARSRLLAAPRKTQFAGGCSVQGRLGDAVLVPASQAVLRHFLRGMNRCVHQFAGGCKLEARMKGIMLPLPLGG